MTRLVVTMFSAGVMLSVSMTCAQNYPNKPIRIATGGAGGGSDFVSRQIAQGISGPLGQQVIVDNRGSLISVETAAKAAPDGYTLLVAGNPLWLLPLLQNVSFDPVRDFSPISLVSRAPSIVVVHPSVAVNSVRELITLAKARPGKLNYASSGTGGSPHLSAELFKSMAGVNIVQIPYKSPGTAINDLIGGHVDLMFAASGAIEPHIKSGRLRALAVTSAEPSPLLPGLPTVSATGLPGYESSTIQGVLAPARTPIAIINLLNREIVRTLNRPDVKERFVGAGIETVGSSPERFAAAMKSEMTRMGKVIKEAGIRPE